MASFADAASKLQMKQIDIRPYFNGNQAPSFEKILKSVRKAYPEDPALRLRPLTGKGQGIFNIISTSLNIKEHVNFQRKKRFEDGEETVSIPIKSPGLHRSERQEGLLVTIVDADMVDSHSIPGRDFDAVFKEYGQILKATQQQKYRESDVMNGNRFVVLDRNEKELPDRITVAEKSFLIKYRGKKWFCSSCQATHVGPCPYLTELYATMDLKKKMTIDHHIWADSTLRHTEQSGLKAKVTCMTGATAGQLATAVEEDPDFGSTTTCTIAAGANDVSTRNIENEGEVARRIETSLNRVIQVAETYTDKKFVILNTCPPVSENPTKLEYTAKHFFKNRAEILCIQHDNIEMVNPVYTEPWGLGHPTVKDTEQMLLNLVREVPDVIINQNVISNQRMYRGVNTMYLSGCSGCRALGLFDEGGFCSSCVKRMTGKKLDDYNLFKKIQQQCVKELEKKRKRNASDDEVPERKKAE